MNSIVVVGAGLVGASAACALAKQGQHVTLIDAKPYQPMPLQGIRPLSLSFASMQFLKTLGVWEHLQASATAIQHVHVSDRGHCGITRIHAADVGVAALGYVVDMRALHDALYDTVRRDERITVRSPLQLSVMEPHAEGIRLLAEKEMIETPLLVAADGQHSFVRHALGIPFSELVEHDVVLAQCHAAHHHVAYERFTDRGTIAMLPMQGNVVGLAWTGSHVRELMSLDERAFLQELQTYFGYRLGRLTLAAARHMTSVTSGMAQEVMRPGIILLGNASQTLLPIAAQGFNLGLRQGMLLAEMLQEGHSLADYAAWHQTYRARMMQYTERIASIFATSSGAKVAARTMGLTALEMCQFAKRSFARFAMGLSGSP